MNAPRRLAVRAGLALIAISGAACILGHVYTVPTGQGPAHGVPSQFFGVGPGASDPDVFRKNGWVLADSRDGSDSYVRGGSSELDVSEAEAIVSKSGGTPHVDLVRLRFAETRLATYKALLKSLVDKHGSPQFSEERDSFAEFVLDPKSDHPRPSRVVVHRWTGGSVDLVLVAGLEDPENLIAAMDYQILLLPPRSVSQSTVP